MLYAISIRDVGRRVGVRREIGFLHKDCVNIFSSSTIWASSAEAAAQCCKFICRHFDSLGGVVIIRSR